MLKLGSQAVKRGIDACVTPPDAFAMKKTNPPTPAPGPIPVARWNNALASTPDPRAIRKRALILAAGRVFGDKGFHNTTLDDIAAALGYAGVSPFSRAFRRRAGSAPGQWRREAIERAAQGLGRPERPRPVPASGLSPAAPAARRA